MPQPDPRPGHEYVDAVAARLPWAGRGFVDNDGPVAPVTIAGTRFIADVLEALATMGVLRGAEHHHQLSEPEAVEVAQFLLDTCKPGSAATSRYGPAGYGVAAVFRSDADLEFVIAAALTAATDPATRQAVHDSRRALRRYVEAREAVNRGS